MSEIYKSSLTAITPDFLITDSLITEDKHLDTILKTESNEENESSVEDLNLTPSESEDLSDIKNSSIISSPKIDSLLEEFFGELAHIDLIPPGINEADFDPEEEIHLVEKLFINVPTADVYTAKNFATVEDFALLHEDKIYSESKTRKTAKDKGLTGEVSSSTKNKGRIVAITAEDMQKKEK
nr:hypothetical protein [Tanacetum cinerariifolium]